MSKKKADVETFKNYLQQFPHYTPEIFEVAIPYLVERQVKEGEYFLPLGKICREIAFVEEGLFRHYYLHEGTEITNCFCKEGEIMTSYKSMVTEKESEVAIQAIESSKVILISYESLQKLFDQHLFWQQVGRLAVEQELIFTEGHKRLVTDLSAMERYKHILDHDPMLLQRVPLIFLASYLQIRPETLSRIRAKLAHT
ncbi:MAG: cyclic nucleotide-binding domain-containing protein [Bacteroidota bacterium]